MTELLISPASVKSGEVLLCLGCLATDCRLYDIRGNPLKQTLEELTGLTVSGGLVCFLCLRQLQRCHSFRSRCINASSVLKQIQETYEDSLISVDRKKLKADLAISRVTIVSIGPRPTIKKKVRNFDTTETLFVNIEDANQIDQEIDNAETDNINIENTQTVIDDDYLATPSDDDISNDDDFSWPADESIKLKEKRPKKVKKERVTRQKSKMYTLNAADNQDLNDDTSSANDTNIMTMVLHQDDFDIVLDDNNAIKAEDQIKDVDERLIHHNYANKVKPKRFLKQIDESEEVRKSKLLYRVFVNIWREVSKNKGDFHEMFLRIYKVSFIKYRPKMPKNILRGKNINESVKIMKFVDLHKELADFYNVDIKFLNIEDQKRDMNTKRESVAEKDEYCQMCCKKYVKNGSLERHMKRLHDASLPHRCTVCLYSFDKQCHLAAHLLKSHAMEVRCRDCSALIIVSISSNWMTEAKTHKALHLGDVATCEFCGKTFTARKLYYMHIRAMHRANIDAVTCQLCGDSYNGPAGLRNHIHRMHTEARQCPTCSVLFLNEDTLAIHAKEGSCQSRSACARCGESFPSERLMKEHYDDLHDKCKCDVCKQPYYGKMKYKDHLKVCKGNPFKGRQRATNSNSRKRKVTCEGDDKPKRCGFNRTKGEEEKGEFVCEVCGQGFKTSGRIKAHQKKHALGDKPYICDLCGKAFRLKLTLKTHMYMHTGERPYKCVFCPKTFRQHPHLKAHMPTHTQEKAYECHICKKRFTNLSNRRTHVKTVHEGLPARKKKRP